jgi:hypothetical protein
VANDQGAVKPTTAQTLHPPQDLEKPTAAKEKRRLSPRARKLLKWVIFSVAFTGFPVAADSIALVVKHEPWSIPGVLASGAVFLAGLVISGTALAELLFDYRHEKGEADVPFILLICACGTNMLFATFMYGVLKTLKPEDTGSGNHWTFTSWLSLAILVFAVVAGFSAVWRSANQGRAS